ncbi:MAG: glycoside hydrolase family 38 C-terminal domain-containing protein, partial [Acidimicrobiales bacterium]
RDTGPVRLRVRQPAEVRVLAHVPDVAGFGWTGWTADAASPVTPVTVDETAGRGPALANGLVTLVVDPADGTFGLDGHSGLGRLVDGGDCGDTYNWCPPANDTLVDRPDAVEVAVVERGPLRARIRITSHYRWPARVEGLDRRSGEVAHDVITTLELRTGEAAVRVATTVDNRSRDHRLRAHFPLPTPAATSRAETAFGVVERGLEAEGGPTEAPLPTYPALRFVQAGGLTIVHEGVTEYELVDLHDGPGPERPGAEHGEREAHVEAHELATTLLRSTGMLSQAPMPTRPLPAGPLIRMEGPQLQKRVTLRYAVAIGAVDPYGLADAVLVPLRVAGRPVRSAGVAAPDPEVPAIAPIRPAVGSALTVEGAEVSAVVREGGSLVVRVFNPGDAPTTVRIHGRQGWLVDLRGRPLEPFEGSFPLRPWGVATASLAG